MHFEWIPGQGMHINPLERMKQLFPRPTEAPPVAWFNTDVLQYFPGLLEYPPDKLPCSILADYLDDTGVGIRCLDV
jgi:hypothetical protein